MFQAHEFAMVQFYEVRHRVPSGTLELLQEGTGSWALARV